MAQKALRLVRAEAVPANDEALTETVIGQTKSFYRHLYDYSVQFGGEIGGQDAPAETLHLRDHSRMWTAPRVPIAEDEEWLDASDWTDSDSIPILTVRLERQHARAPFPPKARLTAEVELRRQTQTIWTGSRTIRPSGPEAKHLYLPDVEAQSEDFAPSTSEALVLRFYDQRRVGQLRTPNGTEPVGIPVEDLEAEFKKDGPFILRATMTLALSAEAGEAETFKKGALLKLSQSEWDEGLSDDMPVLKWKSFDEMSTDGDFLPSGSN